MTLSTYTRQIWIPVLTISLILNGFMAGMFVARKTKATPRHEPQAVQMRLQARSLHPRQILRYLPDERRRELRAEAQAALGNNGREGVRKKFEDLHAAQRHMRTILTTDPIDSKALEAALKNVRAINSEISQSGDALVVEIISRLTPEELALIRARIQEHRPKNRRQHRNRG